ncbi:MAG: outer membrane protein assembly factor BamD [Saprospiraceae bacterium]|nr:outer membrane protein assembly factor BamD [Saprospiraceae bacterium]MBK8080564.1 outer membrane protein assembly factor BamD [Saprospiraceae bacterium]MBK8820735.1 outer membrane protein assembly factor BamD [Saprospiraceae bacterium]MBK8855633.1 outer membrane protein assembly factor BamD [Saprospiraceae bacterium]MBK9043517.1 outer membrane protein assembly factor BamD [Saprospiraceae bacterium]
MNRILIFTLFSAVFLLSCKSEYETIRTSNNPEKIYKAAQKYYKEKEYERALGLYDLIIQYYRGRQEAEELFLNYAYCHYYLNDFILSSTYFKNYSSTFSNSENRQEAEYMAAYSNYRLSPNYRLDQTYTYKAIEGFEQFINLYPYTERADLATGLLDEMRKKLDIKAFEQGMLYYKIGQYQSAITSFQAYINEFPETKKMEEVRFLLIKAAMELAEKSIYEKQKERYEEALQHIETFSKKHASSRKMREVKEYKNIILKVLKNFA